MEKKRDEERGRAGTDSTLRGAPLRPGARVSSLKESPQGVFGSASGREEPSQCTTPAGTGARAWAGQRSVLLSS